MRGLFARRRHRGNRRLRRVLKVFAVGAGLGAAAGLLSPPRQAKVARTIRPAGEDSVKPSETPAEVIETEAASERPAAAERPKRSVTAKVSEKPASKKTPKPRQKPSGKTRQDPSE